MSNLQTNVLTIMNYDEFAFFNQQLAAMLREGIPLEGGLKQLSAGMRKSRLRDQIQKLEKDLASGAPLEKALAASELPDFYKRMVQIGARSNDLPGMLTMLADHYHRQNAIWTRLKGLMVYPLIVILACLGLTLFVSFAIGRMIMEFISFMAAAKPYSVAVVWMPPLLMAVVAAWLILVLSVPRWRAWAQWRLPAFREASLAQIASAISLMLRNGVPFPEALELAETLEAHSPAAKPLREWRAQIQAGQGRPAQWQVAKPFPPMFLWLVQRSGENPIAGLNRAAELYQQRSAYRTEMALYGFLPVSILLLGIMVLWEVVPLVQAFINFMNAIGAVGE